MTRKKITVLAIILVSLFAISAVSAADNQTDNVASTDLATNDVISSDSLETEDVVYSDDNAAAGQEVLASSDADDVISRDNDEDNLSYYYTYPYYDDYSVYVYDTSIDYGSSGSIEMSIDSASSSYYYRYYFYFKVYDSYGDCVISQTYSSTSSSSYKYYYLDSYDLSPGTYTIKIVNYYDSGVMDTATLTIMQNEISSYDSTRDGLSDTIYNAYSGSSIKLNKDISFDEYDSSISISKKLTIDGNGHTIDAKGNSRIFSISGDNVVLENIVFKNAQYSSGNGGAIYWSGSNGKLINCTFINNVAENGGAVYWYGYKGNITDCKFTSNSADNQGGALYLYSSFTITNSNFKDNKAEYGGAIAVGDDYSVSIENSSFNNNAADYGSAIKWYNSVGTVNNCFFNGARTNSHKYMYISDKKSSYFYIDAEDIALGEKLNLTISWYQDLQGSMSIDIFSHRLNKTTNTYSKQLDGTFNHLEFLIPNLKSGDYTVNVTYSGDNLFENSTDESYFTVLGKQSNITFTTQNITWGTPIVLNPTVTAGATGMIAIYVNEEYVDEFKVGSKYNLKNVGGPTSEIILCYLGDDNYKPCEYTQTAYVQRLNSSIALPEKFLSGISTIPITFNEDATGYVRVEFAGYSYSGYLVNGTFQFTTYDKVSAGSQYLNINYGGDGKYNPMHLYEYVDVEIQTPTIELTLPNVKYDTEVTIKPYIPGVTGNYEIYVDDDYKRYGSSYSFYPSLGKHDVFVRYRGDSYYTSTNCSVSFRVYKFYPIEVENTKIIYNTDNYLKATFYDAYGNVLSNKQVIFNVGGDNYVKFTDENGIAILNEKFEIGDYPLTIINLDVNERYYSTLTVFTSILAEDMTRYYNSGYDFNATFLDKNAKSLSTSIVLFDVDGILYTVDTDGNGYAKLIVPLDVGTYNVISSNPQTDENKTNKLTIVTSIDSEDMSRAYNSTIDYKATFYDVDGNYLAGENVIFDVGGKQYNAVTDSKGQAILNVGLAKGEYEITSINPVTGQKNVNDLIILERIINNNDVVVYGNEATYYSVRVIDNNAVVCKAGETVEFNLNGKTYNVKTGSDGYASLKISESPGIHTVSATYKGYTVFNKVFVLGEVPSILTVDVNNINYGQTEKISIGVNPEYLRGNVTVLVGGANGDERIFTQKASQSIVKEMSDLNASTYQVTVLYSDFDNLQFNKVVKSFYVSKVTPEVIVTCEGAEYGENSTITVNIQKASGNVTINVGDKTFTEDIIKNGVVIKKISDLRPGTYAVTVTYNGNNNFNKASKSASLEVARGSIGFYTTIKDNVYGQDSIANVFSSFAGKVTLKLGSITKTIDVAAGMEYTVNFAKLNAGKYTVSSIIVPSDKNYENVTDSVNFEVKKANANVNVRAENIELDQVTKITVSFSNGLNGNVKLQLDGKDYVQTTSNSQTVFNIIGLKLGKYAAKAIFDGNANFNAASATANFEVKKIQNINSIIPTAVSNLDYDLGIELASDATGTVTVSINGKDYTSNVANGKVNIKLPQLADGTYPYTVKYSGDSRYAGFTVNNNVKIAKTTIKSGDATVVYGKGYDYKTTFINADGTPMANTEVSFAINNKVFKVKTDANGVAVLNVGLGNGIYKIASINPKTGETTYNTLKIIGGTNATVLSVAKVTTVYNGGKSLTVVLKDIFGNALPNMPVSINLNGKNSVVVTNPNGKATLSTNKLAPKTYAATITFNGNDKYSKSSATAKVVVKKAKPKLTASKKTFKATLPIKKYTVTLKTNKNAALKKAKVTIKINGKTVKAITNNKGKATFKLTKLTKKGRLTATVKYNGSKYYKKLTKKVVITIA